MGNLTDAYDRSVGDGNTRAGGDRGGNRGRSDTTTRGRPGLGLWLLVGASVLIGSGIVLATSVTAATAAGLSGIEANESARVLCGIGLPLVFVGVFALLPSTRRLNTLASIGFVLALFGIAGFWWAYPDRWLGDPLDLTLPVAAVYAVGFVLTFVSLAASVLANGDEASEASSERSARDREADTRTSLR